MKAIKTKLQADQPDEVADFEKGAAAFAKKIVSNFKDFEFVSIYRQQIVSSKCSQVYWREHEPRRYGGSPELP